MKGVGKTGSDDTEVSNINCSLSYWPVSDFSRRADFIVPKILPRIA
jgi:hypothetical protein